MRGGEKNRVGYRPSSGFPKTGHFSEFPIPLADFDADFLFLIYNCGRSSEGNPDKNHGE